ncbi:MAG: hypothetical protein K8S16_13290 [Bacteroidales bacterium]|nr:hypothetical protein [Bacteroidales bacterium]
MKKSILTLLFLTLASTMLIAQPSAFKYQTVVRDATGEVLANQPVSFQISILQGSSSGTNVYTETHSSTTNQFGLINMEIGSGTFVSGDFTTIDWGGDNYFLQIELDETGGTNYQLMGTSQLLSVPYSNYSFKTGDTTRWMKGNNNALYYDNGNIGIGTNSPLWDYNLDVRGFNTDNGGLVNLGNSDNSHRLSFFSGREYDPNPFIQWKEGDPLRFSTDEGGWSEKMRITSDGKIGIGTTTPSFNLDILSSSTDITSRFRLANSDNSKNLRLSSGSDTYDSYIAFTGGSALRFVNFDSGFQELMRITSDGKLAIGTTYPIGNLDIHGNDSARIYITPADTANSLSSAIMFRSTFGGTVPDLAPRNNALIKAHFDGGGWETAALSFHVSGSDCMIDSEADPCERLRITSDGLVGIGATTPWYRLDVRGNHTDDGSAISLGNSDLSHQLVLYGGRETDPNPFILWKEGDPLRFSTDEGGWSEKMRITSDGLVGIGATTPWYQLDIRGNTTDDEVAISVGNSDLSHQLVLSGGRESDPNPFIRWKAGDPLRFSTDEGGWSEKMRITSDGLVGIGTTNPGDKLHVAGDVIIDGGAAALKLKSAEDNHVFINFYANSNFPTGISSYIGHGTPGTGDLTIRNNQSYSSIILSTNQGIVRMQGKVVIEDPFTGLPVVELGAGLDYAEGFNVTDKINIEPGTVLCIDTENPGHLKISEKAYDKTVAGIVAGAKGLGSGVRLGTEEFDFDVALAGRVYCNTIATTDDIEPGDLLTTSSVPGYATKISNSKNAHGAILGKAMESLEKGHKGQILVLVTLH